MISRREPEQLPIIRESVKGGRDQPPERLISIMQEPFRV
jgi:hypothetical protein